MGGETRLALTREAARRLDTLATERYAIPAIILMENAAVGLRDNAARMLHDGKHSTVLVACGPGNNGGDGLALARHLDNAGVETRLALAHAPDAYAGDARTNMDIVRRMGLPATEVGRECPHDDVMDLAGPHPNRLLVVDALFGTGLTRPIEGRLAEVVEAVNALRAAGASVLSVDTPSGLDADTGRPLGATVRATVTATFVAPKAGFDALEAEAYLGEVRLIDIGAPRALLHELGRHATPRPGDALRDPGAPPGPRGRDV